MLEGTRDLGALIPQRSSKGEHEPFCTAPHPINELCFDQGREVGAEEEEIRRERGQWEQGGKKKRLSLL